MNLAIIWKKEVLIMHKIKHTLFQNIRNKSNISIKNIGLHYFQLIMKISLFYFYKIGKGTVQGEENLDKYKSCILALNHNSYLDWMVVYAYFKYEKNITIKFLAKEKLFKHILWKPLIYASKCILVPETPSFALYRDLYVKLRKNNSIVAIFPEGTRSPNGEIQDAHGGIINIALTSKKPIIPVGLSGFYDAWPRHKKFPKMFFSKKMIINIGSPILLGECMAPAYKKENTKKIMNSISALVVK